LISAQQNRLCELMAHSDDCWGADLSDDELDLEGMVGVIRGTISSERSRKEEMAVSNKNHRQHL